MGEALFERHLKRVVRRIDVLLEHSDQPEGLEDSPLVGAEFAARSIYRRVELNIFHQVAGVRSDVGRAQQPAWRKLTLDRQVPVVDHRDHKVRGRIVSIGRGGRVEDIVRGRRAGGRKRIRNSTVRIAEWTIRLRQNQAGAERCRRAPRLMVNRGKVSVVKHTSPAADAGLPVSKDVPRETQAWSKVLDRAVVSPFGNALVAGKQQTLRSVGEYLGSDALLVSGGIKLHHPAIQRVPREERLEAESHVHGQTTADVIVVLKVDPVEVVAVHEKLAAALGQLV